jgi:hypothetical protein
MRERVSVQSGDYLVGSKRVGGGLKSDCRVGREEEFKNQNLRFAGPRVGCITTTEHIPRRSALSPGVIKWVSHSQPEVPVAVADLTTPGEQPSR